MSIPILWHPEPMTADSPLLDAPVPLAARMRPRSLAEIVGQERLLRPGSPIFELAQPPTAAAASVGNSVILWGPPGTGKTTIAQVIARSSERRFIELSAITAGVKDVREVMNKAKSDREIYGVGTLLFLDEIHRFSKAQQDALLPGVEAGWVTLIAATTENPSFSVISPLLSRSLLCVLEPLSNNDVAELLRRAVADRRGLAGGFSLSEALADRIAELAGGDARRALNILEAASRHTAANTDAVGVLEITESSVESALDRALVRYDRDGDQHYDIISAFIKSIRGSDADAAIHWLARMIEGGEDPRFISRRLIILAAEDIGLADPQAIGIAVAAAEAVSQIGMPEGRIPLSEATIYLALAPKSNAAYLAINEAIDDVKRGQHSAVPKPLRSSNYPGASRLGNGQGYVYPHDDPIAAVEQAYLDKELSKKAYYRPKLIGFERELSERWAKLRAIVRGKKR